jgi:hypothetical protein
VRLRSGYGYEVRADWSSLEEVGRFGQRGSCIRFKPALHSIWHPGDAIRAFWRWVNSFEVLPEGPIEGNDVY